MGWKSVVWTSCLLPVLAGCGAVRNSTSEAPPVPMAVQREIKPVIPYIPLASAKQNRAPPPREMPKSGKFGEPMRSTTRSSLSLRPTKGKRTSFRPTRRCRSRKSRLFHRSVRLCPRGNSHHCRFRGTRICFLFPTHPCRCQSSQCLCQHLFLFSAIADKRRAEGGTTPTSGTPSSTGVLLPATPPVSAGVGSMIPVVPFQYAPPAPPIPFSKPQK